MPVAWTDVLGATMEVVHQRYERRLADAYWYGMGPGEVSPGNDQHSKVDAQGRGGHRSGTVGGEPAKLMIVQLAEPPAPGGARSSRSDAPAVPGHVADGGAPTVSKLSWLDRSFS